MTEHTCPNCNHTFIIDKPDTVGHEGATMGLYSSFNETKSPNFLYDPAQHRIYPWCPECEAVDTETPINPEQS